jgi:hypothetical protein
MRSLLFAAVKGLALSHDAIGAQELALIQRDVLPLLHPSEICDLLRCSVNQQIVAAIRTWRPDAAWYLHQAAGHYRSVWQGLPEAFRDFWLPRGGYEAFFQAATQPS